MRVARWVRAETLPDPADEAFVLWTFYQESKGEGLVTGDGRRRGEKPQEGRRVSREPNATSAARETPEGAPGGDAGRKTGEEAREKPTGGGEPKGEPARERGEPWRGRKPRRASGRGWDLKEGPPGPRTHAPEQGPEAEPNRDGERQEGNAVPRGARLELGERLWRANPKGVTGMKQGREASGEARRQEAAKAWRRNVPGEASPGWVGSGRPKAP